MCPLVSLHMVLLDELHAALITAKWLLSTVNFLMSLQQIFLNETHATLAALERSLSCVDEDMSAQVVGAPESGATVFADVRFLTWGKNGTFSISHQRRFGRSARLPLGFDSLRFWLWPLCLFDTSVLLWLLATMVVIRPATAQQHISVVLGGWVLAVLLVEEAQVLDDAVAPPLPASEARSSLLRPREQPSVVVVVVMLLLLGLRGLLLFDAHQGLQKAPGVPLRGVGRSRRRGLLLESHVRGRRRRRGRLGGRGCGVGGRGRGGGGGGRGGGG